MGDGNLLRLNIMWIPIENKYRKGKMERTLKRELKVREIARMNVIGCIQSCKFCWAGKVPKNQVINNEKMRKMGPTDEV